MGEGMSKAEDEYGWLIDEFMTHAREVAQVVARTTGATAELSTRMAGEAMVSVGVAILQIVPETKGEPKPGIKESVAMPDVSPRDTEIPETVH